MPEFVLPSVEDLRACLTAEPRIAETAAGPVEWAARGEGPVLLAVHGGPGGFDQGLLLAEVFRANGFRVVSVSRPGYLGTPLTPDNATPEGQADLLAAFIEAQDLGPAAVIGASAGGPPSYLLAVRHPDKVRALIEVDSVSRRYAPKITPLEEKLFITPTGLRITAFFADHFPKATMQSLLVSESTLDKATARERSAHVAADPLRRTMLQCLLHSFADRFEQRQAGVKNDLARYAAMGDLPLSVVACPALILHGTADGDVDPGDARYAAASIPGAEAHFIETGSHLGFWLTDDAPRWQERAVRWLQGQG